MSEFEDITEDTISVNLFSTSTTGENDYFSMYCSSIWTRVHPIMMVCMTMSHYFLMLIIFSEHCKGLSLVVLIPPIQNYTFLSIFQVSKIAIFVTSSKEIFWDSMGFFQLFLGKIPCKNKADENCKYFLWCFLIWKPPFGSTRSKFLNFCYPV